MLHLTTTSTATGEAVPQGVGEVGSTVCSCARHLTVTASDDWHSSHKCVYERLYEWLCEQVFVCVYEWASEWLYEWLCEQVYACWYECVYRLYVWSAFYGHRTQKRYVNSIHLLFTCPTASSSTYFYYFYYYYYYVVLLKLLLLTLPPLLLLL